MYDGDGHGPNPSDENPALPPDPKTGGPGTVPVPVVRMVFDGQ